MVDYLQFHASPCQRKEEEEDSQAGLGHHRGRRGVRIIGASTSLYRLYRGCHDEGLMVVTAKQSS